MSALPPERSRGRAIVFLLRRYLVSSWLARRSRSNATIGVLLPIIGVGVGVCAFTVILSVMGGFVHGYKNRLLNLEPHIEVVVAKGFGRVPANEALLDRIQAVSKEIVSVSPFQKGDVILQAGNRPMTAVLVGLNPQTAAKTTGLERYLSRDRDLSIIGKPIPVLGVEPPAEFPAVVLGADLLNLLGVDVGDRITLVSPTPDEGPGGFAPKQFPVVIGDVLATGSPTHDAKLSLSSIDIVNRFYDIEGEWAGVQVRVRDPLALENVVDALDIALADEGLRAKPWTEANKALLRAFQLERWGMSFVLYMVIVVGCFTITITLVLAVKRKSREMAILRAMGLSRWNLGSLFLLKGFVIGSIGVAWGLALGYGILWTLRNVPLPMLSASYGGKPLPVLTNVSDTLLVSAGSLVLAIVAAFWPTYEVMKIDVVETLADRM